MGGCGVDRLRHAGGRTVALAVVRCTQVRTTFHDSSWNGDVRQPRIVAVVWVTAARVRHRAAGVGQVAVRLVPVAGPFPNVADHVVQAVAVGWVGTDRGDADVAVGASVAYGKLALPGVGHPPVRGSELFTPGVGGAVQPSAAGEFPLRLRRQLFAGPTGVRLDVGPGELDDWTVPFAVHQAARALRVAPVGAGQIGPPVVGVPEVDGPGRWDEDSGSGNKHVRSGSGVVCWVWGLFGHSQMAGFSDELGELVVGHGEAVDPEAADTDLVRRRLLRIVTVRPHQEGAARDPDHVR